MAIVVDRKKIFAVILTNNSTKKKKSIDPADVLHFQSPLNGRFTV